MKNNNIEELNVGPPTVESHVNRLYRHQDRIENIVSLIEWDDDRISIAWNSMSKKDLAWFILKLTEQLELETLD